MYTKFDEPFWNWGKFPLADGNGTCLQSPWASTGSNISPFDQDFYLVINVAIGGTNGWFEDGKSRKPWIDTSPTAKKDFWQAREMVPHLETSGLHADQECEDVPTTRLQWLREWQV